MFFINPLYIFIICVILALTVTYKPKCFNMCHTCYQLYIYLNKLNMCFLVLLDTNTYITEAYCAILFELDTMNIIYIRLCCFIMKLFLVRKIVLVIK